MMQNKITVAIILFNAAPFVEDALKSFVNKKVDFNIIILDDASTDGTQELVTNFLNQLDPTDRTKFNFHFNSENVGTVRQLLNASNLCKTEYLKIIDCADPFLCYDFSDVIEAFELTDSDVIFTKPVFFENGILSESKLINKLMRNIISLSPKYRLCSLYSANHLVSPSAFVRTSFIKKIVPQIMNFRLLDDWPLWLYASFLGSKFAYIDKPFIAYRIHQAQREKSSAVKEMFINDGVELDLFKNRLIPWGGSYLGRVYYNLKSNVLNRILYRINLF